MRLRNPRLIASRRRERLTPIGEVLDPDHPLATEGRHLVVQLGLDLQSAPPPVPVVTQPCRDTVAAVDELLRLEPQLLERVVEPFPEAPDLVRSDARVRALALWQHPLNLRVEPADRGVEVAPVVGPDEVPDLVEVGL